MGAVSKIAWTHSTFNPWIGCTRVSPGCENCYAETQDAFHRYGGSANWGARAPRYGTKEAYWNQPAKWEREAVATGERRHVFCGSMCDWLEDRPDLVERRLRLMREIIPATPHLDWLLLTKRPENASRLVLPEWMDGAWPRNAWFGFTGEDQEWFDRRWAAACAVPAPSIWCSYEPALGPIDFSAALPEVGKRLVCRTCRRDKAPIGRSVPMEAAAGYCDGDRCDGYLADPRPSSLFPGESRRDFGFPRELAERSTLAWVIFGGESGAGARPFNIAWARSAIAQCRTAGVACFIKQDSGRLPGRQGRFTDAEWAIKEFPHAVP